MARRTWRNIGFFSSLVTLLIYSTCYASGDINTQSTIKAKDMPIQQRATGDDNGAGEKRAFTGGDNGVGEKPNRVKQGSIKDVVNK